MCTFFVVERKWLQRSDTRQNKREIIHSNAKQKKNDPKKNRENLLKNEQKQQVIQQNRRKKERENEQRGNGVRKKTKSDGKKAVFISDQISRTRQNETIVCIAGKISIYFVHGMHSQKCGERNNHTMDWNKLYGLQRF